MDAFAALEFSLYLRSPDTLLKNIFWVSKLHYIITPMQINNWGTSLCLLTASRIFGYHTARPQSPNWQWSLPAALQWHCRMQGFLQVGTYIQVSNFPSIKVSNPIIQVPNYPSIQISMYHSSPSPADCKLPLWPADNPEETDPEFPTLLLLSFLSLDVPLLLENQFFSKVSKFLSIQA